MWIGRSVCVGRALRVKRASGQARARTSGGRRGRDRPRRVRRRGLDSVKVHLSCGTEDATIRYTTNGHTPNSASAEYVDRITLGLDSQGSEARYVIKSIGILVTQMSYSLVMVSDSILVQPQVAPPNFEPDPSVDPIVDKVLITLSDLSADIFYTVDGSNPMTSRSRLKYDEPFLMSSIFPGTNTVSVFAI
jgi:hypothetical protein